jgi:putative redox protein
MIRSSGADIEDAGEAEVEIAGRKFNIRKEFIDDLSAINMHDAVSGLGRPLLVCHSPDDRIVGIDNATEIFAAARHPKCFVSLDSADHLCSNPADARYAGSMIATWARRYAS